MSDSGRKPSLFTSLHHLSLVVEDLDRTVGRLERLGFGPFVAYPPLREYVQLNVPDAQAFYDLRVKVCEIGPVALQIIEAKDTRTIYGAFLKARGEGVFHLGFRVDDIALAEQEIEAEGVRVLSSGRRADGSGFVYLDTEPELGVALLVRQNPSSTPLGWPSDEPDRS